MMCGGFGIVECGRGADEERLAVVNQRITTGENPHFQLTRRGRHVHWTLEYPSAHEPANHPFFEQTPSGGD